MRVRVRVREWDAGGGQEEERKVGKEWRKMEGGVGGWGAELERYLWRAKREGVKGRGRERKERGEGQGERQPLAPPLSPSLPLLFPHPPLNVRVGGGRGMGWQRRRAGRTGGGEESWVRGSSLLPPPQPAPSSTRPSSQGSLRCARLVVSSGRGRGCGVTPRGRLLRAGGPPRCTRSGGG